MTSLSARPCAIRTCPRTNRPWGTRRGRAWRSVYCRNVLALLVLENRRTQNPHTGWEACNASACRNPHGPMRSLVRFEPFG